MLISLLDITVYLIYKQMEDRYIVLVVLIVAVFWGKFAFKLTVGKIDIFNKFCVTNVYLIFTSNANNMIYKIVVTPQKICEYYFTRKLPFIEDN